MYLLGPASLPAAAQLAAHSNTPANHDRLPHPSAPASCCCSGTQLVPSRGAHGGPQQTLCHDLSRRLRTYSLTPTDCACAGGHGLLPGQPAGGAGAAGQRRRDLAAPAPARHPGLPPHRRGQLCRGARLTVHMLRGTAVALCICEIARHACPARNALLTAHAGATLEPLCRICKSRPELNLVSGRSEHTLVKLSWRSWLCVTVSERLDGGVGRDCWCC